MTMKQDAREDDFHVEVDGDVLTFCWPNGQYLVGFPNGKLVAGQAGSVPVETSIAALAYKAALIARLREALGWFLTDERFQVAVGGNPNVVDRMLDDARTLLTQTGDT